MVEMAMFNVQKAITPKVSKPVVCKSLIVLYICVKFYENTEWTQVHSRNGYFQIYYVQRAAAPKEVNQSYRFLCSACCLMVLYICEKFHNISNDFQLTARKQVCGRKGYVQCSKGDNSKNRQT